MRLSKAQRTQLIGTARLGACGRDPLKCAGCTQPQRHAQARTCTSGMAQAVARRKAPTAQRRYSSRRPALRGRPSRSAGSSTCTIQGQRRRKQGAVRQCQAAAAAAAAAVARCCSQALRAPGPLPALQLHRRTTWGDTDTARKKGGRAPALACSTRHPAACRSATSSRSASASCSACWRRVASRRGKLHCRMVTGPVSMPFTGLLVRPCASSYSCTVMGCEAQAGRRARARV